MLGGAERSPSRERLRRPWPFRPHFSPVIKPQILPKSTLPRPCWVWGEGVPAERTYSSGSRAVPFASEVAGPSWPVDCPHDKVTKRRNHRHRKLQGLKTPIRGDRRENFLQILTRGALRSPPGGYSLKVEAVRLAKLWLPERIDELAPSPDSYTSPAMTAAPPAPARAPPGSSPADLLGPCLALSPTFREAAEDLQINGSKPGEDPLEPLEGRAPTTRFFQISVRWRGWSRSVADCRRTASACSCPGPRSAPAPATWKKKRARWRLQALGEGL